MSCRLEQICKQITNTLTETGIYIQMSSDWFLISTVIQFFKKLSKLDMISGIHYAV